MELDKLLQEVSAALNVAQGEIRHLNSQGKVSSDTFALQKIKKAWESLHAYTARQEKPKKSVAVEHFLSKDAICIGKNLPFNHHDEPK